MTEPTTTNEPGSNPPLRVFADEELVSLHSEQRRTPLIERGPRSACAVGPGAAGDVTDVSGDSVAWGRDESYDDVER